MYRQKYYLIHLAISSEHSTRLQDFCEASNNGAVHLYLPRITVTNCGSVQETFPTYEFTKVALIFGIALERILQSALNINNCEGKSGVMRSA